MVAVSANLLSKCAKFRDQGEFINIRLKVGEDLFPAHRIVLAANSDYFHAMFTDGMKESNQEVIQLKDESISPDALKIVMDCIYTGDLHVNTENVFEVLAAADHLQVTSVVQHCCDFLKREFIQLRLDLHNYCLLCTVADRHELKDLIKAAEHKMASMYKDVCESEEFLTHISADQIVSLLSRDDLSAPSETFVFKSVMQWIKHKKEERMAVAAKVIGAVRLGLVDIRVVIEELNTEEMQRDPEIHMQLHEVSIYKHMPSYTSTFAVDKAQSRSMSPVLVAIFPQMQMECFEMETRTWKPLSSIAQVTNQNHSCFCAEYIGNYMYLAAQKEYDGRFFIYHYNTVNNSWGQLPPFLGSNHQINRLCSVDDYVFAISESNPPQRYSLANNNWQSGANLSFLKKSDREDSFCTVEAVVLKSKVFVIHGYKRNEGDTMSPNWVDKPAVVHCLHPAKNEWEQKASTCKPHFGSSLFVINNRLYVIGGRTSCYDSVNLCGNPAPVEVYNEENNTWSVVEQTHIPPNNLGAVEIDGRVYFVINKFPIDSGIRIPPDETYDVSLNEWENLAKISKKAVLCYVPVKRESLKTEQGEKRTALGIKAIDL